MARTRPWCLNGVKVTEFTEGDPVPAKKFPFEPERGPRPQEGYIGLQNHSDNDIVFFKEVAHQDAEAVAQLASSQGVKALLSEDGGLMNRKVSHVVKFHWDERGAAGAALAAQHDLA